MNQNLMEKFNSFFEAVLKLESVEEAQKFFEDVCTIKEVEDMTSRLEVAKLLIEKTSYGEISKKTGASTATISRVNRCLNYGKGGYKTVIDRLTKGDKNE